MDGIYDEIKNKLDANTQNIQQNIGSIQAQKKHFITELLPAMTKILKQISDLNELNTNNKTKCASELKRVKGELIGYIERFEQQKIQIEELKKNLEELNTDKAKISQQVTELNVQLEACDKQLTETKTNSSAKIEKLNEDKTQLEEQLANLAEEKKRIEEQTASIQTVYQGKLTEIQTLVNSQTKLIVDMVT